MAEQKEWFDTWFDTPYYHILYKNRDFDEASAFIKVLYQQLRFRPKHKALDVACGKGRHSIHLNQLGLQVTGIDLSRESIQVAKQFQNESLRFYQHDMREVFKKEQYDYVLNLFTSFGYFTEKGDNKKAIKAMAENLKPGGTFVLDFFNPLHVIKQLVPFEEKVIDGIKFIITKTIEENFIVKSIEVVDGDKNFNFQEIVKAISKEDFEEYFKLAGLSMQAVYGDYKFNPFTAQSERMIFIATK